MSDTTAEEVEEAPKSSKLPLILSVVALLAGGGAGFYATFSGMLGGGESEEKADALPPVGPLPDVVYVPIEPMVVSLKPLSSGKHLKFRAQIEVPSPYREDVESVMPRIIDVMNGYLRAIDLETIEAPASLTRIRSHLLRRIQIITGNERARDLLIMEFVVN